MTLPHDDNPTGRPDDDEVFRQIVAGFGAEATDPVPRWPVSEDAEPLAGSADPEASRDAAETYDGLPEWVEPAALPDEGHYVPPEPPRLPRVRLRTMAGLALVVVGLLALFIPRWVLLDDTAGSLLLGMLFTVAGAALLLGSLRDGPGPDDRPDDGAVV